MTLVVAAWLWAAAVGLVQQRDTADDGEPRGWSNATELSVVRT